MEITCTDQDRPFPSGVVLVGDCLARLKELPDASVDAVVCDPPYGLADLPAAKVSEAPAADDDEQPQLF